MEVLKELLKSKKFIAMLVGVLTVLLGKVGLDLDEETLTKIVGLVAAYVLGQGIADHGKEQKKIGLPK